jgi:3',5'-cyclic AMP phosphodiesterase CpdA
MTLIAQITDLHIRPPGKKAYGVVDTEAMLRAAVASILAQPMKPDAVIASATSPTAAWSRSTSCCATA